MRNKSIHAKSTLLTSFSMRFQFRARLHKSNPLHNDEEGKGERCEVGYAVAKKMPIFLREFMSTIFLLMIGFFPFLFEKDNLFKKRKNQKVHIFSFEFEIQTDKERERGSCVRQLAL